MKANIWTSFHVHGIKSSQTIYKDKNKFTKKITLPKSLYFCHIVKMHLMFKISFLLPRHQGNKLIVYHAGRKFLVSLARVLELGRNYTGYIVYLIA